MLEVLGRLRCVRDLDLECIDLSKILLLACGNVLVKQNMNGGDSAILGWKIYLVAQCTVVERVGHEIADPGFVLPVLVNIRPILPHISLAPPYSKVSKVRDFSREILMWGNPSAVSSLGGHAIEDIGSTHVGE